MDILKTCGMQRPLCEEGARMTFGDATLIIASAYSQRFQAAKTAADRLVRTREQDKLPPLTMDEWLQLEAELYADCILLGWENVQEHGAEMPPTRENRVRLLRDAPPFFVAVKNLARDFAPYSLAADEVAQGNSVGSSPGSSGGDPKMSDGLPDSPAQAA